MAAPTAYSKDFPLDAGVFTAAKLTIAGSTDANVVEAVLANNKFPDGNIQLGHLSFTADTGKVSLQPAAAGGATVSFDLSGSAQSGMGVYGKSADAIAALSLTNPPKLTIPDVPNQRYLLMDFGYSASFSGSASHPIGMLGTVSFGVNAKGDSMFAILHRFDAAQGAHQVIADTLASWRLPRNVSFDGNAVNLKPATWVLAEADGTIAITLAASLGWNMNFAKDARLLGVTQKLSAKIDASLKVTFGFSVSGSYILVVGREDAGTSVRLQLWKQSSKGLNFGFNLAVGVQGADPQLPSDFNDFIRATFGVHGLQVLQDLQKWTDPSTDLGQKLAGLGSQSALDLLKNTTGVDPAAEFDKAKQVLANALNTWTSLPDQLSSMLWKFLGKNLGNAAENDFKSFLTALSQTDPDKRAAAFAQALQSATFGDTPQGQFLEAVADQGLLALGDNLGPVSTLAGKALDLLNGGIIAKLQTFIDQKLDLDQIRKAVSDTDFANIEQWLQARLGNFLDKTIGLDDLKDIQKAITTLDTKIAGYYKTGIQALTKHYSATFAATYQSTTTDTALIDVIFNLAENSAAALFGEIMSQSKLDRLLTQQTKGVILNQAKLTHEIKRQSTVDLDMPFFDFTSTHVNDAMVSLTAEDHAGRVLLYQLSSSDKVTVANRAASQLSVLASLNVAGGTPQFDTSGSIAYELLLAQAGMRPLDLESRTTAFIHQYLAGLFGGGDASLRTFYTDLDHAITAATKNTTNQLGDMAVSMQLSMKSSVLAGWFQPRSSSQLRSDQMRLSRALQAAWKSALPALFFQELGQYEFKEAVAALLVWTSLPISTSIAFNDPTVQFNTDQDVMWDFASVDLRRAVARDSHSVAALAGKLHSIQAQLSEAGNSNADFFDPSRAGQFIEMALNPTGDSYYSGLLYTESQLVRGAASALQAICAAESTAATTPSQAIRALANFAADVTDTFNQRVSSLYSGMQGRVIGPMLLVEASKALGSTGAQPSAMLTLYGLKPAHTFVLGTFVDGKVPAQADIALTQNLVSLT